MSVISGPLARPFGPRRRPLAAAAALAVLVLLWGPLRPARAAAITAGDAVLRSAQRTKALLEIASWPQRDGPGVVIHYAPGLASDAAVVAAAAAVYEPEVMRDYGLSAARAPATMVVVSPAEMVSFVGAQSSDPPLGAYYEGVIWLLAPSDFLPSGPSLTASYERDGPVAHELTHLADDIASGGRTPAWFDEGLAQYEDWRLAGYVWTQPDSTFSGGVYSWSDLTGDFETLPNVALAYRQALAATAAICRVGPGTCVGILHDLRSGLPLQQALLAAVGPTSLASLRSGSAWQPGMAPVPDTAAGPRP